MTWVDSSGEVRPESWEEYCEMVRNAPDWPATKRLTQRGFPMQPEPKPRSQSQMRAERLLRMRLRLFNADPHCFWCGIEVKIGKEFQGSPAFATVDHLYSRWHPQRKSRHVNGEGVLHVLACQGCNQERAGAESQRLPFIPKLKERLEFAQRADATLARDEAQTRRAAEVHGANRLFASSKPKVKPRVRTICTLKEAIEFARENPSR